MNKEQFAARIAKMEANAKRRDPTTQKGIYKKKLPDFVYTELAGVYLGGKNAIIGSAKVKSWLNKEIGQGTVTIENTQFTVKGGPSGWILL